MSYEKAQEPFIKLFTILISIENECLVSKKNFCFWGELSTVSLSQSWLSLSLFFISLADCCDQDSNLGPPDQENSDFASPQPLGQPGPDFCQPDTKVLSLNFREKFSLKHLFSFSHLQNHFAFDIVRDNNITKTKINSEVCLLGD